ncbi:hypothetical protein PgNI_11348 [Pyricularia grisea]|uniref:Uncharacterized protein n=1 Tax=Pyricularia grisea TaxID=148305 RepID=A0A6P8APR6_PYRGI|nr:hypothetical protein PgNI_11348 [Pyricularia grisea]TLD04039.1 hypothetical protein PgNI_11348 [Pyricularia grisea]
MEIVLRIMAKQNGREQIQNRKSVPHSFASCVCEWVKPDDVGAKNSIKRPLVSPARLGLAAG